jgi:hypothetical protein
MHINLIICFFWFYSNTSQLHVIDNFFVMDNRQYLKGVTFVNKIPINHVSLINTFPLYYSLVRSNL